MKKLVKSFLVVATLLAMTMGMATLVSAVEPTVTAPEMIYTTDKPAVRSYVYNQDMKIDGSVAGVVIPVKVASPGVVQIGLLGTFEKDGYISASKDQNGDGYLQTGLYDSFSTTDTNLTKFFNAKTAGTYYIRVFSIGNDAYTNRFTFGVRYISLKDKNLVLNKSYAIAAPDYKDVQTFKYKAKKTGIVTVGIAKEFSASIEVLNGKRKQIISRQYLSDSNSYAYSFAVKKGQTYYINVSGMSYLKANVLGLSFKNVKEKSGKKKAKAVNIKAKKKFKGIVNVGDKGDWYKFTNKKTKKVKILLNTFNCEDLQITLYDSKGKFIGSKSCYTGTKYKITLTYGSRYGIAKKGKYYIKISGRNKKKSSGYYELSWK
ncbi:MAG: hypothetical protein K6G85_10645 [Eubacterium sp.]|nr:hypothetical protein [Eubacterium sp.]